MCVVSCIHFIKIHVVAQAEEQHQPGRRRQVDRQASRLFDLCALTHTVSKTQPGLKQVGRQTDTRHVKEQLKQVAVIIDWNVLMWLQWCIVLWWLLSYGEHYNRLHIPLANSEQEHIPTSTLTLSTALWCVSHFLLPLTHLLLLLSDGREKIFESSANTRLKMWLTTKALDTKAGVCTCLGCN